MPTAAAADISRAADPLPSEIAAAPADVQVAYVRGAGDARRYALSQVRNAGWFRTAGGWRQLTPDLRAKVNVREAVRQPDGRYVIEDVDCFYPNSVKGAAEQYTAAQIRRIVRNTNAGIA